MITSHLSQDVLYYLAFLGGQLFFMLKRAASAIRSKTNPIASRAAFFYANWDVLCIRCALEFPVYMAYRHYTQANGILHLFTTWSIPDWLPQVPWVIFLLGYVVDSKADQYLMSPKAPEWLKETVPGMQVFSQHTVGQGTDGTGAPVIIEKTVTVEKPPEIK